MSFADLPFEIRSQIWNLTCEPRILCLHINQHVTPVPLDSDGKRIANSQHNLSIGFDCSIVTSSPSKEFDEYNERLLRLAWQAHLESSGESPLISFDDSGPSKELDAGVERHAQLAAVEASGHTLSGGRIIQSPAALYVCQESRALALQRYKRAFGRVTLDTSYRWFCSPSYELGDTSAFDDAVIGQPTIWVDFERDVIVVDSLWQPKDTPNSYSKFPERTRFSPLSLIRIFAKEESKSIRRLGVAARQLKSTPPLPEWRAREMGKEIIEVLRGRIFKTHYKREWFLGFDNLEELLLDDVPHVGYHHEIPGWRSPNPELKYQPLMTMREEILHRIGKPSAADPSLAKQPPEIRMVGENDWSSFLQRSDPSSREGIPIRPPVNLIQHVHHPGCPLYRNVGPIMNI
jgi:hypothetical protein